MKLKPATASIGRWIAISAGCVMLIQACGVIERGNDEAPAEPALQAGSGPTDAGVAADDGSSGRGSAGAVSLLAAPEPTLTESSPSPSTSPSRPTDHHPISMTLVFSDEFTGTTLDRSKWCTRYQFGGGKPLQIPDPGCVTVQWSGTLDHLNDEQQRYVDINGAGEKLHVVSDGILSLRATKTGPANDYPYESAMIRSKPVFAPGVNNRLYMTARMRLPDVVGTWPAFWLAPSVSPDGRISGSSEIDMMEGPLNRTTETSEIIRLGSQPHHGTKVPWGTVSYAAPGYDPVRMYWHANGSLRSRWVEIGVDWSDSDLCYFVDGLKVACEPYQWTFNPDIFVAPAHLLLNLAIGGNWAGRDGIDDARFPARFDIDYVRVYSGPR